MEDLPDRAITYSPPSSFKNKVPLPATNYAHKSKHSHIPLPSYRISNNRVSATRPSKNATRSPSLANLRGTETVTTTTTTSTFGSGGSKGSANSPFGVTLKSTKTTSTTTTSPSPSGSPGTVNKNTKSGKSQPLGGSGGGNKVYDGEAASRAVKSFTKKLPKFASKKKKSPADEKDKEEKEREKERLKEKKEREKKEKQKEKEREKFRERQEKALREYELGDGFKRAPTQTGEVTTITISSPKLSQKPAKPITARKPSPSPPSATSKPQAQPQPRAASPPLSPNSTRALPTPVAQSPPSTTDADADADAEAKAKDEAELAAMPAWRRQVILKKRQREAEEKAKAEEKEKAKLRETQGKLRAAELERERQEKELLERREREEREAKERQQEEEEARKQAELEERQRESQEKLKKEQEEKARKEQETKEQNEQKEREKKEAESARTREEGDVMSLNLELVRPDVASPPSPTPSSPTSPSAADSLLADLTGPLPPDSEGDISNARIAPTRPPKPTKPRSFAIKSPRGIFSSITSPRKMEGDTSSEKKPLKKRRKEEKRALKDAEKKAKLREADLRRKDEELAQKERELALEARELELREREEKLRQRAQHLSSSGSGAAASTSPTSTPPLATSPQSSPPQSPRSRSRAKQRGIPRSARELSPEVVKRGDHSSTDLHKKEEKEKGREEKEKEKERKQKEKEREKEKKEREKEAEKAEKEEKEREREKKRGRIFGKLKSRGPGKKGERKDDVPPVPEDSFISSPINTSDPVSLNPHRFLDDRSRTTSEMMYLDELEEDGGDLVEEVLDSVQFVGGGEGASVGGDVGGEYGGWGSEEGVTVRDGGVDYPPPSSWGDEVEEEEIQCPNCGTSLPTDSLFCEECGHRLDWAGSAMDDPAPPSSPPEPLDYDETDSFSPTSPSYVSDEALYFDPPTSASVAQHILSPSAAQSKEAYLSTTFGGMDMLRESYDGRKSEEITFESPVVPALSTYDGRNEEMAFESPVVPVSDSYDGTMASYKEKAAAKKARKEKLAESYLGYQGGNWVCNKCNVTNIQDDASCMMCGNSQPPMVSPPPGQGQGQGDLPENENYRQKAPGRNTQIFSDMRIDIDNLDDFFS
eukprot:TRINITY_DN5359_c0_g1_i1.p1 TRINITY_DN5359_c0_g1~~TRINITY_DN5359_c0_g1_i1.p1  ORF type:complete len:1259 (-),score=439.81 TRINITY_DN5359_c0_g1_i1:6-3332(-)